MSESEAPPVSGPPPPSPYDHLTTSYSMFSSFPSLEASSEDDIDSSLFGCNSNNSATMWQNNSEINWQERCFELEMSLERFREQATKIRELLRNKLVELETRLEEAERRASAAEEKAKLMEEFTTITNCQKQDDAASNQFNSLHDEKDKIISALRQELEKQKNLRTQEAQKVEAKASILKTWVTNKLKEREEQNRLLWEENQRCNRKLELLKNHLYEIQQHHPQALNTFNHDMVLPEDMETDREVLNTEEGPLERKLDVPSWIIEHGGERQEIDTLPVEDALPNFAMYAKVDYSKKKSHITNVTFSQYNIIENPQYFTPTDELDQVIARMCDVEVGEDVRIHPSNSVCTKEPGLAQKLESEQKIKPVPLPRQKIGLLNKEEESPTSLLNWSTNTTGIHDLALVIPETQNSTNTLFIEKSCDVEGDRRKRVSADNELHDYAEIYTPSNELPYLATGDAIEEGDPPSPPKHHVPPWESRIYEIAVNGINTFKDECASKGLPVNSMKMCSNGAFTDISIPVYATVKGRPSQIRSAPFTGESSDSSDNEEVRASSQTVPLDSLYGHRCLQRVGKSSSTLSPTPVRHGTSISVVPRKYTATGLEELVPSDYNIPPDTTSTDWTSSDTGEVQNVRTSGSSGSPKKEKKSLEKSGYLTKLGGKFKTWQRRWFVLKNGALSYYKTQNDVHRKPQGQIILNEICKVDRAEGAATFEVSTGKKTYYLTAESVSTMEEWITILQKVLRRSTSNLMLCKEETLFPNIEGWLTKVAQGDSRHCWCVLNNQVLSIFKTPKDTSPSGQINLTDARVQAVYPSDSDKEGLAGVMVKSQFTVGIFFENQGPTYLLMSTKQEMDEWLFHLTAVSSEKSVEGTSYEQLVARLMDIEGEQNNVIWRHPLLLYSKENLTQPLTTLPTEQLQTEAGKLFKSIQLFTSVPLDASGIDYHVALAQNTLQQCLIIPELQREFLCQLIKQTSQCKKGTQLTRSSLLCNGTSQDKVVIPGSEQIVIEGGAIDPPPYVFIQAWQLLALAVSLFVPLGSTLWLLRTHFKRNSDPSCESGKYAIFCQRALERTLENGGREYCPSRMEVLSILVKNPFHHSHPHSIPVHFLNGAYQVIGFDGSTTVEEFVQTVNAQIGIRDLGLSRFSLYSDDPIDPEVEHYLQNSLKICDVITKWEQALREKHLGKFETTKAVRLTYKNRICLRQFLKGENEKEKLLTAFQIHEEIMQGRFPANSELIMELAALLAQVDYGDYSGEHGRGNGVSTRDPDIQLQQVVERFVPVRYRETRNFKDFQEKIKEKWRNKTGRSMFDCVRIYLNSVRKWSFCGSKLFSAKLKIGEPKAVWLAVGEDGVAVLDFTSMKLKLRYPYSLVTTFGGCREDFMIVTCNFGTDSFSETSTTERFLFCMPKPKIFEITLLMADYMKAIPLTPSPVPPRALAGKVQTTISGTISPSPHVISWTC
ncbi:pleckstrin homology domain-containing family H member 1-like isoform X1 [Tachypleus tridentatus]|uniref:pleckstrin homology domain-containing family H member 1-like isoform X1 n=2 Tax=Tachypleus tridentatus TaxID=6853 RepID=UPI003FD387FC